MHTATTKAITDAGYAVGLPGADSPLSYCAITHGTGHGIVAVTEVGRENLNRLPEGLDWR
jgi:hypothetical protein